jgi:hypothetical protein
MIFPCRTLKVAPLPLSANQQTVFTADHCCCPPPPTLQVAIYPPPLRGYPDHVNGWLNDELYSGNNRGMSYAGWSM